MSTIATRRDLVKGAAAASLGFAMGPLTARADEGDGEVAFESTVDWGDEYDVVVIGYGGAGASAAIAAADEGASVLIVEKAPKGAAGGSTRLSGGTVLRVTDTDKAREYFTALAGSQEGWSVDEDAIETMVEQGGLVDGWLKDLGMDPSQQVDETYVEWPEYPGGDGIECFAIGGDFNSVVWKLDKAAVEKRGDSITVWYEAPARHLVQDPATGIVHGVTVEVGGSTVNVRARNGVVMACGGYENSPEIQQQYLYQARVYPIGTPYNTGDGIAMALEVGADLWHMSCWAGPSLNFVNPDTGIAAGTEIVDASGVFGGGASGFAAQPMIVVAQDGQRFMDEKGATNHGHRSFHGTMANVLVPRSSWCVFDETARTSCRVYASWSEGAEDELDRGWVLRGDSIRDLAVACGIDADGLAQTVERFNGFCEAGLDADFGADPSLLLPLERAPFYAVPLSPCIYNSYGGPRRNGACQVVSPSGDPIPHLYGAGECGSFWGFLYQGGGNISETMYSGWVAGRGAAQEKGDSLASSVLDGKSPAYVAPQDSDEVGEAALGEGESLGRGQGIGGDVVVKVTMGDGRVTDVKVVSESETQGVGSRAIEQMPAKFIGVTSEQEAQAVDGVSGATITSQAMRDAVADAVSQS